MNKVSESLYESEEGYKLEREYGYTPHGNGMRGRWVLRDAKGEIIDFDMYRNDIASRNNLSIYS